MFDVRTYEDNIEYPEIHKENNCKHASVIGGGLLGLELANSLKVEYSSHSYRDF